jgi:hypothetical protein
METVIITKKEYKDLINIKDIIERILTRGAIIPKEDTLSGAFGILKKEFKGSSLDYISKLRKEWRK